MSDELHLTRRQLEAACEAWQRGALGFWAPRAKLKDWGVKVYGELVALVRAELGDDTDYSQEDGHGTNDT